MLEAITAHYPTSRLGQRPSAKYPIGETDCGRVTPLPDSLALVSDASSGISRLSLGLHSWWATEGGDGQGAWGPIASTTERPDTLRAKVIGLVCPEIFTHIALEVGEKVFSVDPLDMTFVYDWSYPHQKLQSSIFVIRGGRLVPAVQQFSTEKREWIQTTDRETYLAQRHKRIVAKRWPSRLARLVESGKVGIGMTAEMVRFAWGEPERVNTTTTTGGEYEQWVYDAGSYLYFTNDLVSTIQSSR